MRDDLPDVLRRLRRARLTFSLALTATVALAYFLYIGLLAFAPAAFATPFGPNAITSAGGDPAGRIGNDWPSYNGDLQGTRYSSLTQITPQNANTLKKVCSAPLKEQGPFQGEPLIVAGTIYVETAHDTYAIDGKTCALKWSSTYTPVAREVFPVDRGAALVDGKLIRGTPDGHLLALDASSGKTLWNVKVGNGNKGEFLSSAPIVWNGTVYEGVAGADWGVMGRMFAFDPANGKVKWTFTTIASGNDPNAKSWPSAAAAQKGGGGLWTSYTLDPASGTLFIPVSNPAPDFAGTLRNGANLYTNSVVALDANSGTMKWFVQTLPHDVHDWDMAAPPVFFTASNGKTMIGAASKDGQLYGIDATTHKIVYTTPEVRHTKPTAPVTMQGTHMCPADAGGAEWSGPAYDRKDDLLITPMDDWCGTVKLGSTRYTPGQFYLAGTVARDDFAQAKGALTATDPVTGKIRWKYAAGSPMLAGAVPTASGVTFTGDMAGNVLVFDSATGKVLFKDTTQGSIAGGVVPYSVDGTEYLAVTSGNISRLTWGNHGSPTLVVYAL
jgi:alcohol dehydrogenase (cytochrome c)